MKVHELAAILDMSPKDLLAELKRMRLPVKNHLSPIDDHDVERIKSTFLRRKTREQGESEQKQPPREVIQETSTAPAAMAPQETTPAAPVIPSKPRTKTFRPGFLIKPQSTTTDKAKKEAIEKARSAREITPTQSQPKSAHRHPTIQTTAFTKKRPVHPRAKDEAHITGEGKSLTSPHPEAISPKPQETKERPRGRRRKKDSKTGELIVPTIEVMSFKELKKDIAERWKKRSKGKKTPTRDEVDEEQKRTKKIRPSFYVDLDTLPAVPVKRPKAQKRRPQLEKPKTKSVLIQGEATVEEFAEKIEVPVEDVLAKLEVMGETFTPNQTLSTEHCQVLAEEFNVALEIIPESDEYDIREYVVLDNLEKMKPRPPVVTIMGHVDHGKTTLLDSIRKSDIASQEFGGITQHIGAYCVKTPKGDIVFLDTPGHAAFTAMRARGAKVTDIVVLVISADDGVMPQTVEAINHAKAANVPIIVAINKMDKAGANPDHVKQELMKYQLVSEELGGETLYAEIAAKTGANVEKLLELIHLQAEILELKAEQERPAEGAILESHMDPLRGVITTLLVQKGALRTGDVILTGNQFGKIRAMIDNHGRALKETGPSMPVEVVGLTGVPTVGESFLVMPDEKTARRIASIRTLRRRIRGLRQTRHVTLENLQSYITESETKELNIVLKGDVQGSIEAISQSLEKLSTEKVKINILHAGVGGINESDVHLADASDAIIIGFTVRPEPSVAELAQEQMVEIKTYRVIYELLDEVKMAMRGLLEPKYKEVEHGRAEVRQVFKISKLGNIAGCFVLTGEIKRSDKVRLIRDNTVVFEGKISSLRRVKEDVSSVQNALECGIGLDNFNDVKEGDIIETYVMEEIPQEL